MSDGQEERLSNENVERLYTALGPLARGFLEEARHIERDRDRIATYAISAAVDWADLPFLVAVGVLEDVGNKRNLVRGDASDMWRLGLMIVVGEILDELGFGLEDGFPLIARLARLLRRGAVMHAPN